jgi:hypothetical protein
MLGACGRGGSRTLRFSRSRGHGACRAPSVSSPPSRLPWVCHSARLPGDARGGKPHRPLSRPRALPPGLRRPGPARARPVWPRRAEPCESPPPRRASVLLAASPPRCPGASPPPSSPRVRTRRPPLCRSRAGPRSSRRALALSRALSLPAPQNQQDFQNGGSGSRAGRRRPISARRWELARAGGRAGGGAAASLAGCPGGVSGGLRSAGGPGSRRPAGGWVGARGGGRARAGASALNGWTLGGLRASSLPIPGEKWPAVLGRGAGERLEVTKLRDPPKSFSTRLHAAITPRTGLIRSHHVCFRGVVRDEGFQMRPTCEASRRRYAAPWQGPTTLSAHTTSDINRFQTGEC